MKDLLAGEVNGELNIISTSRDPRARFLSNLVNRPFEMEGQMFASFEGFYQGIKFPPEDRRRWRAFASSYGYAKQFGQEAIGDYVWWPDEKIHYASRRHKEILARGLRASFEQNPDRMEALLATRGLKLRHETGEKEKPYSPLPKKEFCKLLTRIRDKAPR